MKPRIVILSTLFTILLTTCAGQATQRIIVPRDPVGTRFQEWVDPLEAWKIVETQNGLGDTGLPGWVRHFYDRESWMIESMDRFLGRYIFIAKNQGGNFNALRQWADNFCPERDLARLIINRVERRFVAGASLYPDDEYGEYFMRVIRMVSNGEYPGAVKEEAFWVRRKMVFADGHDPSDDDLPQTDMVTERFEYLVLISIDRSTLQGQLRHIMDNVRTTVPPTREQAAAIGNIRQNFFEGF
ncbi:MAG: hypothetical protein FWD88_05335 [Treponema sp.]|nr:hypothetical protein [Treponema sp.]